MGTYGAKRQRRYPPNKRKTHLPGNRYGSAVCGATFPLLATDIYDKPLPAKVTCERCRNTLKQPTEVKTMAIIDPTQVGSVLGPLKRANGNIYRVLMKDGTRQDTTEEDGERLAKFLSEEQAKRAAGGNSVLPP